ncbi:MAG TPA: type II toxin-antitoxin system VapC family toxin, partial [Candidatus Acidoferrum sp.]|nr:type II toxin-antitoxin system VapC family toxin [Candidatus Acidoferrum sp.]
LLDSNILIYAANKSTPEIESLATSADNAVAVVTRIEVYGFTRLKPEEQAALDILFRRLTVHPLDEAVVARAIALRQQRKMGLADAIVAATALVHNLTLVTRNEEDFRHVTGLLLLNPFAPAS